MSTVDPINARAVVEPALREERAGPPGKSSEPRGQAARLTKWGITTLTALALGTSGCGPPIEVPIFEFAGGGVVSESAAEQVPGVYWTYGFKAVAVEIVEHWLVATCSGCEGLPPDSDGGVVCDSDIRDDSAEPTSAEFLFESSDSPLNGREHVAELLRTGASAEANELFFNRATPWRHVYWPCLFAEDVDGYCVERQRARVHARARPLDGSADIVVCGRIYLLGCPGYSDDPSDLDGICPWH